MGSDLLGGKAEASRPIVDDFGRIAQLAAAEKSQDAVHGLVQGMEYLLNRYDYRLGAGSFRESDFDLFKVVGHELAAVLVGHLIGSERWALVGSLFSEEIHHSDLGQRPSPVRIDRLSQYSRLLMVRSRSVGRISVHADLLKERHEAAPPVGGVVFDNLLAADLMLFLGTYDPSDEYTVWYPRSAAYMGRWTPRFLSATSTLTGAQNLVAALQKGNPEAMKVHVTSALSFLRKALRNENIWPSLSFDPAQIVTE